MVGIDSNKQNITKITQSKESQYNMETTTVKQPLLNLNNGCYIDVMMIALFRNPSPLVKRVVMKPSQDRMCVPVDACSPDPVPSRRTAKKIQTATRNVALAISNGKTTNLIRLRKIIRDCPELNKNERFDAGGMNDCSVFFEFLIEIFPCLKAVKEKKQTVKCPDCSALVSYTPTHSPLFYLAHGRNIARWNGKKLSEIIKSRVNEDFNSLKFKTAPLILFDFTRLDENMKYRDDVCVLPDRHMSFVRGGPRRNLRAIVVWADEHYAVFALLTNGAWFYFDGNQTHPYKIGSWEKLLRHDYDEDEHIISPIRNSKLYVY